LDGYNNNQQQQQEQDQLSSIGNDRSIIQFRLQEEISLFELVIRHLNQRRFDMNYTIMKELQQEKKLYHSIEQLQKQYNQLLQTKKKQMNFYQRI
jgi:hypothetical protein